jgi:hypothetical protein
MRPSKPWRDCASNLSLVPTTSGAGVLWRDDVRGRSFVTRAVLARHPDPGNVAAAAPPEVLMLLELLLIDRNCFACNSHAERLRLRYRPTCDFCTCARGACCYRRMTPVCGTTPSSHGSRSRDASAQAPGDLPLKNDPALPVRHSEGEPAWLQAP